MFRHDLDPDAYRQLAAAEPFRGVVEIEVDLGFGTRRGSGVVVADTWVLTAAHVVNGAEAGSVGVRSGGRSFAASELHVAEGWSNSPTPGLTQGSDLALVRLTTPTGLAAANIAKEVSPGGIGFIGGFGRTGTGVLGASGPAELLFAMNVIDRRFSTGDGGGLLVTDFDDGTANRNALDATTVRRTYYDVGFDDPKLSVAVLDSGSGTSLADWGGLPGASMFFPGESAEFLEGSTAPGDSGGPMFVLDEVSGNWQVAGLSSWGVNPLLAEDFARNDSRYGDLAFFTDLTPHRDWMLATIPESKVLVCLGGLLLLRRRRRVVDCGSR